MGSLLASPLLCGVLVPGSLVAGCGLQDLGDGAQGQPCLVAGAEPGAAAAGADDGGACWDVAAAGEAAWPVSDADQWLAAHGAPPFLYRLDAISAWHWAVKSHRESTNGVPWYGIGQPGRFAAQLGAFLVVMLVVSSGGWLLWRGLRAGAVVAIATIPLEALSGTASRCLSRPCSRWSASCWCSLRGPGCAAARSGPEGHAARLAWKAEWLMRSLTGRRIPGS
jgi:hypothetical protein